MIAKCFFFFFFFFGKYFFFGPSLENEECFYRQPKYCSVVSECTLWSGSFHLNQNQTKFFKMKMFFLLLLLPFTIFTFYLNKWSSFIGINLKQILAFCYLFICARWYDDSRWPMFVCVYHHYHHHHQENVWRNEIWSYNENFNVIRLYTWIGGRCVCVPVGVLVFHLLFFLHSNTSSCSSSSSSSFSTTFSTFQSNQTLNEMETKLTVFELQNWINFSSSTLKRISPGQWARYWYTPYLTWLFSFLSLLFFLPQILIRSILVLFSFWKAFNKNKNK